MTEWGIQMGVTARSGVIFVASQPATITWASMSRRMAALSKLSLALRFRRENAIFKKDQENKGFLSVGNDLRRF
jgi:hypothetical protein